MPHTQMDFKKYCSMWLRRQGKIQ